MRGTVSYLRLGSAEKPWHLRALLRSLRLSRFKHTCALLKTRATDFYSYRTDITWVIHSIWKLEHLFLKFLFESQLQE